MFKAVLLDVFGTLVVDVADISPFASFAGVPVSEVARVYDEHLWALADGAHGPAFRTLADLEASALAATEDHFRVRLPGAPVSSYELFPDAAPFLAALTVPVCLVSDADRDHLSGLLRSLGVTADHVVTSEDARAYKPRPEPFRMALSLLGLAAADVLHVGDNPDSDLAGAAALGIATAYVNRTGRPVPPSARPTYVVTDLRELLPHVRPR
ncbi:HAD family hydrolase [Paractinoplanes brasiliensis]|uniref:2-haloacid dehalogenase/putative hydrolase of the HAD superfamily n=1 Tax=Paractinoplanes brasiliensis TaxID=52695 RepID=A0A4R6J907_9ACTN|nr:HAD family hydrolase [Actinoplanes brasiliensis]TDO31962.1 2-haloacid dehalogenase/putative hydrolase of the HAD superfamily [Actinoplanes brasiliensis]GID28006.1 hypothetical protein Abr02nite_29890 [Actinoplanes brasiliensis]